MSDLWEQAWYGPRRWTLGLLPLTGLFRVISAGRRRWQTRHQARLSVPVVVVGNISIGGTGKTPLLIALVKHLQQQGYQVGVISRGYGAKPPHYPYHVTPKSAPELAGDEPLSIVQATGCPLAIDPDRVAAARYLIDAGCNLLLSDDGLQHYRLPRALEIAVVDGQRLLGNGHCLPAGPLREPATRLAEVDMVVINSPPEGAETAITGHNMHLQAQAWVRLQDDSRWPLDHIPTDPPLDVIAGIGNPARFTATLSHLGYQPVLHRFADHHAYRSEDLAFARNKPLAMTAKDAVKCRAFAEPNWYYLAVDAELEPCFWDAFDAKIAALSIPRDQRDLPPGTRA